MIKSAALISRLIVIPIISNLTQITNSDRVLVIVFEKKSDEIIKIGKQIVGN
jgi:hypothetical protein